MKLVDVNLLLYAVNRDSVKHAPAKAWLEDTLSSAERVALPWVVLLGFIRIATNPQVLSHRLGRGKPYRSSTRGCHNPRSLRSTLGTNTGASCASCWRTREQRAT